MQTKYTSRQGQTVDLICSLHYGLTRNVTEQVLDANPGLAAIDAPLPVGTVIVLPDIVNTTKTSPLVSLWD